MTGKRFRCRRYGYIVKVLSVVEGVITYEHEESPHVVAIVPLAKFTAVFQPLESETNAIK